MTTKGRLRRSFPGPAISMCQDRLADVHFREAIAQLLTRLDTSTPHESFPVAVKAKAAIPEIRDTIHPKYVTEMLTGILRGIGQPANVTRIYKCTRDDVLLQKALKPWRRSPLWLLLRVVLQTSLMTNEREDHKSYKTFMIFFMARILERSLQASLPSDLYFIMAAKISRRTLKLAVDNDVPGMQFTLNVVQAAHQKLSNTWQAIEQRSTLFDTQHAWQTTKLSFPDDTQLSLVALQPYLASISNRTDMSLDRSKFLPSCHQRMKQQSEIPQLDLSLADADLRLSLMDLELWAQKSLGDWLATHQSSKYSCTLLAKLIQDYKEAAFLSYAEYPESISRMLLTLMDLWVALDKCANYHYPLLSRYDPGFPRSLFDPLLLPRRSQMERLYRIEQYIQQRRKKSSYQSSLIFRDINKSYSFGVQYFEQSSDHRDLRRKIETAAMLERSQKKMELEEKRQEYDRLMAESNSLRCEQLWNEHRECFYHSHSCRKCQLKDIANSIHISVHEWPIPYIELEAKSAVFELDVPVAISRWRDITYILLVDAFSPQKNYGLGMSQLYHLPSYSGLNEYYRTQTGRLQLSSTTKPYIVAHYATKQIFQANNGNILVNNGLHYSMFDSTSNQPTGVLLDQCDVRTICTFQLPSGPYTSLQFALAETTHTSNEILAKQSECAHPLNLHEFYSFGTLRSGHRLQWLNIARELTTRILNFSHEEIHLLIIQASWQAGCSGFKKCRDSHLELEDIEFGVSLLSALEEAIGTVEGNWQGAVAVRIFVALTTRLLSMSPHHTIHESCYIFLRRARDITISWARDVCNLIQEEQDEEMLNTLTLRVLEVALTCHNTFGVDIDHRQALLTSNKDISVLLECCIIIHDRCPAVTQQLPRSLKMLLRQYEAITHSLELDLRRLIIEKQHGINSAVRQIWKGYNPICRWKTLEAPCERWLETESSTKTSASMTVHYNILDGSLLVNGSPLTRVPRSYELHATYRRLFGDVSRSSSV
jgi:hypothetical protein